MTTIPGRRRLRVYERKAAVEMLAVVPPVLTAAVTAVINLRDPGKRGLGWLLVAGIAWLVAASVVRVLHARAQDREQKRREDYDGLLGAMHVLYGLVSARAGIGPQEHGRLRVTIHRVVQPVKGGAAEELEQLLPYIGGARDGAGRKFSIRSGVIGKAVRGRGAVFASRASEDYEQFLSDLVRDWAYTEHDARRLTSDRRAWMAVPVFDRKKIVVMAVVYLDSNETEFFTPDLRKVILEACGGVASYVNEVYE